MEMHDLRRIVRDVLDGTDDAHPASVAKLVAAEVADAELRDALLLALVDFVRDEMTRVRMAAASMAAASMAGPTVRPSGQSARVSAVRDAHEQCWLSLLRTRVHVGAGEWKLFADCGYEDLKFCAQERYEQARRNRQRGDWYERAAELLCEAKARRVADLDMDRARLLWTTEESS